MISVRHDLLRAAENAYHLKGSVSVFFSYKTEKRLVSVQIPLDSITHRESRCRCYGDLLSFIELQGAALFKSLSKTPVNELQKILTSSKIKPLLPSMNLDKILSKNFYA